MLLRYATAILPWLALVAGLVLPTIQPSIGNISTITLMLLAIPLCWHSDWRQIMARPPVAFPLLAGALLALACAFTAKSPWDIGVVFTLAPLYLVGPLTALFERLETSNAPTAIGFAALGGAFGAVLVASYDVSVLHMDRAGFSITNPIHFAGLALGVGFVALVGLVGTRVWWRPVFLLGPVLAVVAVILSGSRGPIMALLPMFSAVLVLALFWLLPRRWAWSGLIAGLLAIAAALALGAQTGWLQSQPIIANIVELLQTGVSADASTMQRVAMYRAALNAFMASPVFGHGLVDFIAAAAAHAPPDVVFPSYEHLHSDIADFAVIGGLMGLCAYGLLIAAPIAAAWRLQKGPARRAAMLLAVPLAAGYLAMGLTNAMFGILNLTVLYSVGLALVAYLSGPKARFS